MSVVRTVLRTVRTLRTVTRNNGVPGADAEGGGVSTFTDLTDKASADLPAINTPLASALASLSAQLSGKAPSSGIAPSAISGTAVITTDARLSDARTPTAHAHPASEISDSTATGRSILTAATQSDARTNGLGSGATGDLLFQAASPAAARTTLGFDGMVPKVPFTISVQSDFTTASTSFVGVTELSFAIEANKRYAVSYYLLTNKNDTAGLAIQFTGPASPTKVSFRQFVATSSFSVNILNHLTAFSTPSTTMNTFVGDAFASSASGILNNGPNAGTVQLQLRAVTGGTAKIYAGSYIQVTEL